MDATSPRIESAQRLAPASRTRLRGGRLLDLDRKLICSCTLYDLESGNIGIIVQDEDIDLPATLYIEDDRDLVLALAKIVWRMGSNLGIAHIEPPIPLSLKDIVETPEEPETG